MIELFNGECEKKMRLIPNNSVDMVLCDLPYGCTDFGWDKIIDGRTLFQEYKRVCKQNANVVLFANIKFAEYLMNSTFKSEFSHCLVWVKNNTTRAKSASVLPLSKYELILVFRVNKYKNSNCHENLRDYFSNQLAKSGISVNDVKNLIPNYSAHHWFRGCSDYRIPTEENYRRLQEITGYFKRDYESIREEFLSEKHSQCTFNRIIKEDVISCSLTEKRVHPTQKPVELLQKLILTYSNPNDTVLDNTMGSGSTGVAAIKTGRNFIGIEKDINYFRIAEERMQNVQMEIN